MATVEIQPVMSQTKLCRPQPTAACRSTSPRRHYDQPSPESPDTNSLKKLTFDDFFNLMKYERLRLITYILYGHQWPKTDIVSPSALANAGFFYLEGDKVQCAFCRGKIGNWEAGHDAMTEHKRHFPKCQFVKGNFVGNVSMDLDPDIHSNLDWDPFHDECPGVEPIKVNYNKSSKPKFPMFRDVTKRALSFTHENFKSEISKRLFIEAGFFYTGKDDCTRCYHCGGVLFNWKPTEIPMEEHALFFPECPFVIETKGENYLMFVKFKKQIIEMRSKMDTSEATKMKDIECMRKISFENFRMMNQAAKKILTRLGEAADEEHIHSSHFYEDYIQRKQLFFLDCQKLFIYLLHGLGVMSRPGEVSADSEDDDESVAHSVHSNPSVFSLADSPTSDSDYSSCNSDSDNDGGSPAPQSNLGGNSSSLTCAICYDKQIQVVFIPCGHQMACMKCATKIDECPICRQRVTTKIRTYFASVPN